MYCIYHNIIYAQQLCLENKHRRLNLRSIFFALHVIFDQVISGNRPNFIKFCLTTKSITGYMVMSEPWIPRGLILAATGSVCVRRLRSWTAGRVQGFSHFLLLSQFCKYNKNPDLKYIFRSNLERESIWMRFCTSDSFCVKSIEQFIRDVRKIYRKIIIVSAKQSWSKITLISKFTFMEARIPNDFQ